MVGRPSGLSVPWSFKMSPRMEGRPMGPATLLAFDFFLGQFSAGCSELGYVL